MAGTRTDEDYSWSVASALWQMDHGEPDEDRTLSAYAYLAGVLTGEVGQEAAQEAGIGLLDIVVSNSGLVYRYRNGT